MSPLLGFLVEHVVPSSEWAVPILEDISPFQGLFKSNNVDKLTHQTPPHKLLPIPKAFFLHHSWEFVLPPHFTLVLVPLVKNVDGDDFYFHIAQHGSPFYPVIVVDFLEFGVNQGFDLSRIAGGITTDVPFVGIKTPHFPYRFGSRVLYRGQSNWLPQYRHGFCPGDSPAS